MNKRLQTQMKAVARDRSFMPVRTGFLQRKCVCGGSSGGGGVCAECRKGQLQRRAADQAEPSAVPPIVNDVLRSPGQSLDAATRAFMEPRFGHDFSQVRVHTGSKAAESALAVNALAFTVGREVVFGAGQYAPHSPAGRRLLAHELAHTAQQDGEGSAFAFETTPSASAEQEAEAAAQTVSQGGIFHSAHRAPAQIARQERPDAAQTHAPAAVAPQPMNRAEFDKIMKDRYRVTSIRTGAIQDQPHMNQNQWKAWDPGSSSEVYNWIVEAFVNFEKSFGGLPDVKEIIFLDTEYVGSTTGADYSGGRLTIYSAVQQGNKMLNLQGALESPTAQQAVKRNITHELGHGVFDKKTWKERPLTGYMATRSAEDFSEAIMAYANEPQRLKTLSPARYDFIDKRKARWLASGQPKVNIWEQVIQGGPARTLKPSRPPTIWERLKEEK
jgi:hypothetical protein